MAVVPAHFLVVRAVGGVRSPQRDDDVARLRAVVVAASYAPTASPFGRGQGGEGEGRVVRFGMLGMSSSVAHHADHGGHEQEEGRTAGRTCDNSNVGGRKGAIFSTRTSGRNSGMCVVSSTCKTK